ncbi:MAG: hypothetical protein AUJ00_06275 [Gemmatimonadetes bacterium 13_1_40CM_3_70_6]|nr:MAG: hypothetical protein AUJ00_06275 [Gemmatimonadetes bacterium 13_1_40CM_3_70_6]
MVGLLAAGIVGIVGFSYSEMHREALQSARARLSDLARMIADQQLAQNARTRVSLTRQAAEDPMVAVYLQSPGTRTAAAATPALQRAIRVGGFFHLPMLARVSIRLRPER